MRSKEGFGFTDEYSIPKLAPASMFPELRVEVENRIRVQQYPNRVHRKEDGCTGGQLAPRIPRQPRKQPFDGRITTDLL